VPTVEPPNEAERRHKQFAVNLFNRVWALMEQLERTPEEADEMLHAAHASVYHWSQVGGPQNLAIGEWQVSRVYAVLGWPESFRRHAERSLQICEQHGIGDFARAYAFEALARAAVLAGDGAERDHRLQQARAAGEQIADAEDRKQLLDDLADLGPR